MFDIGREAEQEEEVQNLDFYWLAALKSWNPKSSHRPEGPGHVPSTAEGGDRPGNESGDYGDCGGRQPGRATDFQVPSHIRHFHLRDESFRSYLREAERKRLSLPRVEVCMDETVRRT